MASRKRAPAPRVLHKDMIRFCEYHLGKGIFAPFTGTDWRAWKAFVYLIELYANADHPELVLEAMRATLKCAQNREHIHALFVQAIPGVLDWGAEYKIWPEMQSNWALRSVQR